MAKDLSLLSLQGTAAPDFTDSATVRAWLEHLPLADIGVAQTRLSAQIQEFNRLPVRAATRLEVLEALRETVAFVQIEQAKRFTNRALPMADADAAVLGRTIDLWEQMRAGYLRCFDSAAGGEIRTRARLGLICQRALTYIGLKMFHFHRAYREISPRDWRALHRVYAKAEEIGVAEEPVKDYLNRDLPDTSPRIAYLRALLMASAQPNELTQRQLTFVAYLLERWAVKVDLLKQPPPESDVPALVVDLVGEREPVPAGGAPAAAEPRYLDVRKLAQALRGRIGHLRRGESPAKLALGEDCVQPSCEQLLVFLYRHWCMARPERAAERRAASDTVQACNDMAAIHYYLSGRIFQEPGGDQELTREQRDEIATFGRVRTTAGEDYSAARGFLLESWQLVDQSAQGMQIVRRAGMQGKRYLHGQLLAVRPADSKNFMLGQVRWMTCAESGDFFAGVRLLPGLPAPIAARQSGLSARGEKYVQAMSLTAVSALNAPPALVVPPGWFRAGALLDVYLDGPIEVRMTDLLERGADYERVGYEVLGGA